MTVSSFLKSSIPFALYGTSQLLYQRKMEKFVKTVTNKTNSVNLIEIDPDKAEAGFSSAIKGSRKCFFLSAMTPQTIKHLSKLGRLEPYAKKHMISGLLFLESQVTYMLNGKFFSPTKQISKLLSLGCSVACKIGTESIPTYEVNKAVFCTLSCEYFNSAVDTVADYISGKRTQISSFSVSKIGYHISEAGRETVATNIRDNLLIPVFGKESLIPHLWYVSAKAKQAIDGVDREKRYTDNKQPANTKQTDFPQVKDYVQPILKGSIDPLSGLTKSDSINNDSINNDSKELIKLESQESSPSSDQQQLLQPSHEGDIILLDDDDTTDMWSVDTHDTYASKYKETQFCLSKEDADICPANTDNHTPFIGDVLFDSTTTIFVQ